MVVDTAPVSKATDLPPAGDEMVYSSIASWPFPAGVAPRSFVSAAARALVHLTMYRCDGCTCCCGKPNWLRSQPHAVAPTNDERTLVFVDPRRHWLFSDLKEIVSSVTRLLGKNAHAARFASAEPKNGGRLLSCCMHAERRPVDSAANLQAFAHRRRPETYRRNCEARLRCRETGRPDQPPQEDFGS